MKIGGGNLRRAFSLVDVLMVVAVVLVAAAVVLISQPFMRGGRVRAGRISCVNGLKQIGLAHRIWAGDNGDRFPMEVSTAAGGSMESALRGDVLLTYQVMSNELSTPKILICPEDSRRRNGAVTNFLHLTLRNVSYFVGIDAVETNASSFLGGDYNLVNKSPPRPGLLMLSSTSRWGTGVHEHGGNLLLTDGGVMQVTDQALREAISRTGLATNRIAVP